ncbi:alpha/beta hydrolase [Mitsuokella multacida]|uniref:alpha/beta hydrolase n=1 Tax=Mitsuokella multacida TaxID=52226 RepID=UPI0022E18DB1|nr:alpha/beta hydrolase [Mitsuokella multacida]
MRQMNARAINETSPVKPVRPAVKMRQVRKALFTGSTPLREVIHAPYFKPFGRLLFPTTWPIPRQATLSDLRAFLPWYSEIRTKTSIEVLTALYGDAKSGETIFYPIYTEAEQAEMPAKRDTGLFFFRSRAPKRHRTAVCSAGGGFVYVGAIHDSFPHALALSRRGYDAFALIYRPGAKTACEDLARALAFLFAHEQELGISMEGYSLWGGSAGARMSAWLSDYGTGAFGERALPRPAAVVLQYTGLSEVTGREVPTYSCVGDEDSIADCHTVQSRIDALRAGGVPAELEIFPGLAHGFGLGNGTVAEGWLDRAVAFWEAQLGR